jgi:hypothetical protein
MRHTIAVAACAAVVIAVPLAGQESGEQLRVLLSTSQDGAVVSRTVVESRITKGAPYSGEAVTETTQILTDGNRISRKTTTRIYRDSDGRTRRENVSAATGEVTTINISDPVAESTYVLYPDKKVAFKNGVVMVGPSGRGGASASVEPGSGGVVIASRDPDGSPRVSAGNPSGAGGGGGGGGGFGAVSAGPASGARGGGGGGGRGGAAPPPGLAPTLERVSAAGTSTKREELGQQMLEGVLATGTRSTTTIPAGSIGNAKPILIVSEQWFSEDLKALVLTKHSDPRAGETTYRLTNIIQGEPHRSLFEVPADYTLQDSVIRRNRTPLQD